MRYLNTIKVNDHGRGVKIPGAKVLTNDTIFTVGS